MEKTNVMRLIEQKKIPYRAHSYTASVSAADVARELGQDPRRVFKTLVATAGKNKYYVFMIPAECELNLKKAAAAAGEKYIEMIPAKELLPLTGYIHGGCSPIGMKKSFPTFIDESAEQFETILFSAGRIGAQVEMPLDSLNRMHPVRTTSLVTTQLRQ